MLYNYAAKIDHWHDADTALVTIDQGFGNSITCWVRLYGCYAAELDTPEGQESLSFVRSLVPDGSECFVSTRKPSKDLREFSGKQLGQTFARWLGFVYTADTRESLVAVLVDSGRATSKPRKPERS